MRAEIDLASPGSSGPVLGSFGLPVADLAPLLLDGGRSSTPAAPPRQLDTVPRRLDGPSRRLDARVRRLDAPSRRLDARVVNLAPGPVAMDGLVADPGRWIGLLILDGLLVLEANVGRAQTAWLVGAEDLVIPWALGEISLTASATWRVLKPARIALLDPGFSARAAVFPGVMRALVAHAAQTTHWLLARSLAIACPLVEERLMLLFALYAERWGVVTRDGIVLELPLTHQVLGLLCGARRPSVTLALQSLGRAGLVKRRRTGSWLLANDVCSEMASRFSCWPGYAQTLGLGGT